MEHTFLKLVFIQGLKKIVLEELHSYPSLLIVKETDEAIYLNLATDISVVRKLRSIINVYIVQQGAGLNPHFLSKHKSIVGTLIEHVLNTTEEKFTTFRLSCAGNTTKDVTDLQNFIRTTYKLSSLEDADMDIYIGKQTMTWEIGVRLTTRPLSLRPYKIENIKGGLNPTIAFAMNTRADLNHISSYLNVFSGSATLLIEAALCNSNIKFQGFDKDGKTNALAIQNIKKAGLLKKIELKTADIFSNPDLGLYDVIVSDLPFGMQISKNENLEILYVQFLKYCESCISPTGTLIVYTSEHQLLDGLLQKSLFTITDTYTLKLSTSVGAYLYPKIFVCKLKN